MQTGSDDMEHKKEKRYKGKWMLGLLTFFLVIHGILYATGWYYAKVPIDGSMFMTVERTRKDMEAGDRAGDKTAVSNIYDKFYCFEGLSAAYDFDIYVEQGELDIVVLDVGDMGWFYDGMETEEVMSKKVNHTDSFSWDLSGLPADRRYALAIYGSEDGIYTVTLAQNFYIYRYQSIYNYTIQETIFRSDKYIPTALRYWDEW